MTTEIKQLTVDEALVIVQKGINVPKNKRNDFGKYNYRNAEDIIDAAKKLANPLGFHVTCDDEIELIGTRYYVKSTATISNGVTHISRKGYAREEDSKKGMDGSQVTGASSSYARKYALNALFAIDDGIDSDTTNTGQGDPPKQQQQQKPANKPTKPAQTEPSAEIKAAGAKLKAACAAYEKTDAAKSAPVKALLFDKLKANSMTELRDLGKCTNVNVFSELIDIIEAATAAQGVSA